MDTKIAEAFNKFAGREISVKEEKITFIDRDIVRQTRIKTRLTNSDDPIILEMEKLAADNGLELRVLLPDMQGIPDERPDRVSAYVEKAPDGKWRISSRFEIG